MSLLASFLFVLAATVGFAALRSTIKQFADAAIGNIDALRDCSASRDFRIQTVAVIARPVATGDVRRSAVRCAARRFKLPERLRAAA